MSRIVIIDDEPVLRLTFRVMLEDEGHEVWDAENGRVGLAICRQCKPDLVLTDMIMPEQEGTETLRQLRQEFPALPVIAMSGAAPTRPEHCPQDQKNLRFVMKPLDKPTLTRLIKEMLSNSHKRGEHLASMRLGQPTTVHPLSVFE